MVSVTVTWARPGQIEPSALGLLNDHERGRYARLVRASDRQRYLAAHVLARAVLAERLGCPPQHVPLRQSCHVCGKDGHGKPDVVGAAQLSLAHAGDRVVVAVSTYGPVGVDVEDPSLFAAMPRSATLATAERHHPGWTPHRRARNWVCKEAALKAAGVGLAVDPRQVELGPPQGPATLRCWPLSGIPAIAELDLDGYPAAVAIMDPPESAGSLDHLVGERLQRRTHRQIRQIIQDGA